MLESALRSEEVALVLTEPAMSNFVHMVVPDRDWHRHLREQTRTYGTLLAIDETHTHVVGAGGATERFGLQPDIITIGKAIAGGVPLGACGVTSALAMELDAARNVATGGTLFGYALSAAAARTALIEILTPDAYAHTSELGEVLADGIDAAIAAVGLPWKAIRFGPRSGQWYGPQPRTGREALELADEELTRLMRVWLANRGIWEALPGAGPTVPVPAERTDVERYLGAYSELLAELTR
jgi:glutamate-1-semialdehyde 2,1-aminomutase